MKRRSVLKGLAALAATAPGLRLPLVHAADYGGKLFVFVQADGGWDPTSFCDPKANTPGERVINHWAERDEVRRAGNIPYAPFARNQAFFEKYHRPDAGHQRGGPRRRTRTRSESCTTGAGATPRATRRRPRCSPRTMLRSCRFPI